MSRIRLDRDAADGRAVDAPTSPMCLAAGGDAVAWPTAGARLGQGRFVNLHAMAGSATRWALVASKASETPLVVTPAAGHASSVERAVARRRSGRARFAGDEMAGEARRGADVGKLVRRASHRRSRRAGRCFCRCRWTCSARKRTSRRHRAPRQRGSALARRGALAERWPYARTTSSSCSATTSPLAAERWSPSRSGGYAVWGTQLTSRVAFPRASVLAAC